jgi:hypothetical protein
MTGTRVRAVARLDEFFAEAVVLPGWAWALAGKQAPRDLAITLAKI